MAFDTPLLIVDHLNAQQAAAPVPVPAPVRAPAPAPVPVRAPARAPVPAPGPVAPAPAPLQTPAVTVSAPAPAPTPARSRLVASFNLPGVQAPLNASASRAVTQAVSTALASAGITGTVSVNSAQARARPDPLSGSFTLECFRVNEHASKQSLKKLLLHALLCYSEAFPLPIANVHLLY